MLFTRPLSLLLTLFYLAGPLLIVLELFKPALSIPTVILAAVYVSLLASQLRIERPAKVGRVSKLALGSVAFVLCLVWVYYSGIGSFALCRWDYVKHNLIFSYLLDQDLPIYTSLNGRDFILHYSFAYYITPVRIFQITHALWPGVSLNVVLLALYSVALFLAVGILSRWRMTFMIALLVILSLTGGLDAIGMLAFHVKPVGYVETSWFKLNVPYNVEWWGLPYAPQNPTMNLYYAPQHFFGALIGAALLKAALQSMRPAAIAVLDSLIIIAASLFWSAYVAVGLAALAVVLTLGGGSVVSRLKQEGLSCLRTSGGLITSAFAVVLCLAALLFLWGSKPLSVPEVLLGKDNVLDWLLTYALNYAPFLLALVFVSWPVFWKLSEGGERSWCPALPKILAGCLAASAAVLSLAHGIYDDWAMRVTLPLSIALAVALTKLLFGGLKWPYVAALLTVLAVSSASSLAVLTPSILMSQTYCMPYGTYSLKDMGGLAFQYEGRGDSLLYKYFARPR